MTEILRTARYDRRNYQTDDDALQGLSKLLAMDSVDTIVIPELSTLTPTVFRATVPLGFRQSKKRLISDREGELIGLMSLDAEWTA